MELNFTVKSSLPIGDPQGDFPVNAPESMTVGMLIRTVCKDNGIRMKSSYTLKNASQQELAWSSTLRENLVMSGAILYLHDNADDSVEMRHTHCNLWWYMAGIGLLLGAGGLIAIVVLHVEDQKPQFDYGIVMDAGSSHTKLFIYKWNINTLNHTALAKQIRVCTVKGPGISSYSTNPSALIANLSVCLQEAKTDIPTEKHTNTPVFLGATAGMRLLQAVDSRVSDDILSVVRSTIATYPFSFNDPKMQARIISGEEEALFSWITSNYVTGKFGAKPPSEVKSGNNWLLGVSGERTVGALDLGGASTQITFYPGDIDVPAGYSSSSILFGSNYTAYTHSYLCYGINEITRKYNALLVKSQNYSTTLVDPCAPVGKSTTEKYSDVFEAPCTKDTSKRTDIDKNTTYTFEGSSNTSECKILVGGLFNFSAPCRYGEHCSFNGTYQPPVQGYFYAFSNFFYEIEFLNSTTGYRMKTLADFESTLKTFCSKSWSQIQNISGEDPRYLPLFCFRGMYILTLLKDGYKFNTETWQNIRFVNNLAGTEIGWSLGFMIDSSSKLQPDKKTLYLTTTSFILLIILFIAFLLLAIAFALYARKYQVLKKKGMYERLTGYGTL